MDWCVKSKQSKKLMAESLFWTYVCVHTVWSFNFSVCSKFFIKVWETLQLRKDFKGEDIMYYESIQLWYLMESERIILRVVSFPFFLNNLLRATKWIASRSGSTLTTFKDMYTLTSFHCLWSSISEFPISSAHFPGTSLDSGLSGYPSIQG